MGNKIGVTCAFIVLTVLIASCSTIPDFSRRIPEATRSQYMNHGDDWRNLRYGEVIPVWKSGMSLYMEVYNTVMSNELPQDLWAALDAKAMAREYGAEKVILNGPRYWVINEMEGSGKTASGKVANFGGIEMTLRASLQNSIFSGAVGSDFYSERKVARNTTYTYRKGNMVYEITNSRGEKYRMQSYSQIVDPDLTIDDLERLGDRLHLPKGWTYSARVLEADSSLIADGTAIIINDELSGTYQKIVN